MEINKIKTVKMKFLSGRIILILGTMFSGKTSRLISEIEKYEGLGLDCVIIKWIEDKRYNDEKKDNVICSHSKKTHKAKFIKSGSLYVDNYMDYDVVAVDEGQFFSGISGFCDELADEGKIVIVSALSSTFERLPWKEIPSLMAKSDEVIIMTAFCKVCMNNGIEKKAPFVARMGKSKKLIDIGNGKKYIPLCRTCYSTFNKNK